MSEARKACAGSWPMIDSNERHQTTWLLSRVTTEKGKPYALRRTRPLSRRLLPRSSMSCQGRWVQRQVAIAYGGAFQSLRGVARDGYDAPLGATREGGGLSRYERVQTLLASSTENCPSVTNRWHRNTAASRQCRSDRLNLRQPSRARLRAPSIVVGPSSELEHRVTRNADPIGTRAEVRVGLRVQ